ncbi:MAG TPA: L-seryl-tRNA(Sec) selenium transferase [Herpetosiphonaceae bacterium]|nr:L-seryl-tRNA(Sec) selenium transferase [Herpetosiphonaceae bacterium]
MALRDLPAVHSVATAAQPAAPDTAPAVLTALARAELAECRAAVRAGAAAPPLDAIVGRVLARLAALERPSLRPVINGSGVLIQTNLGRAPLSGAALAAIGAVGAGYSNLEYDLDAGERSSRSVHLAAQLTRLTGAEAALAVNNAAAAMLLVLSGLAAGREVLVSRGQAVEIGGGFRIPDVLRQSGCRLVDVGTTNRTYAADYAAALTPDSAAILRVHSSNFRLTGFVHEPALAELAAVARSAGIVLVDDLGSGALVDTGQFGLDPEPTVRQSLEAGADVVVFSGDKLLGGPQAGIIVGRRALLQNLARHPLLRALRVDKTAIAALSATLAAYERGSAFGEIPIWRMISAPLADLRERAERIAAGLGQAAVVASESTVGGGSLPGATLPSVALAFDAAHPDVFAARLRRGDPPLVARINAGRVLVDLRSVLPEEDAGLARVLREALARPD